MSFVLRQGNDEMTLDRLVGARDPSLRRRDGTAACRSYFLELVSFDEAQDPRDASFRRQCSEHAVELRDLGARLGARTRVDLGKERGVVLPSVELEGLE